MLHGEGPVLVLAGAGSGKTRVLTRRLAHLILRRDVPPDRVLAVTFTNKAADEMKKRVEAMLGFEAAGLWIGTFHSICLRLLRRHSDRLGFTGPITVFDDDDQTSLLKEVLKAHNSDTETPKVRELKSILGMAKNKLWSPDDLIEEWDHRDAVRFAELYRTYQKRLRAQNGADFDDLLFLAVKLLEEQEEVGDHYARKFQYVLVDEYQDTNHAQFRLVRRLGAGWNNVMVVGDDDQSIYRWRGADITNILSFEQHFRNARALSMTQNYRSTQNILAIAQAVVEKNEGRRDKSIWTENPSGEPVGLTLAQDEEEEARVIVSRIKDGMRSGAWAAGEVAVLYRVHAQSRAIEEACLVLGLDYLIVGGVAFYQRREVKDLVAYLKLALNPRDEVSFRRVLTAPKRGIGDKGREQIEAVALRQGGDYVAALSALDGSSGLKGKALKSGIELGHLLEDLARRKNDGPEALLKTVVERTDYESFLRETEGPDFEERWANVQELLEGAARFERARGQDSLEAYLDQIALYTNLDRGQLSADRITLMTVHNAKGLEFPVVFITGIEEGLFPHASSYSDPAELEEERRLFYVAATRAMKRLFLSASLDRRRMNRMSDGGPSRFLDEIPRDRVQEFSSPGIRSRSAFGLHGGGYGSAGYGGAGRGAAYGAGGVTGRGRAPGGSQISDDLPLPWDDDPPAGSSEVGAGQGGLFDRHSALDEPVVHRTPQARSLRGSRVEHAVFGTGRVVDEDGSGPDARLTIEFPGFGKKKIVARYVQPVA
ncbi:MAG: UvrD-helicase domain-containing protein [Candidatus Eisenbacteria bacterium]|nr:UvrD-helicase domain-containing protein [Candidatus Eisenbacteria bacterium]